MNNNIRLFILILIASSLMLSFTFAQQNEIPIVKQRPADYEYLSAPDSTGKRTLLKMPTLNKSKGLLKLPYPIIFIHGLNSWSEIWNPTTNFMDKQYGTHYGKRIDFCLNVDGDNTIANLNLFPKSGADLALCTNPDSLVVGDYYYVNFDVGNNGIIHPNGNSYDVISNQQAIAKQGKALGYAISYVLQITGRDKVILMGHSMGGLAAREYLQNWTQSDGQHHVAKLVTTGTPHGGSNAYGPNFITGVDKRSDAVRDLKTSYEYSLEQGVYLFGGIENNSVMDDFLSGYFDNIDVNCNGQIGDNITGLNQKKIPRDLYYSCIIGECTNCGILGQELPGDGVVNDAKADLNNYCSNITKNIFYYTASASNGAEIHTDLPEQTLQNMQGLDEPDNYNLAYNIDLDTTYEGFTTTQATGNANYPVDFDEYKFTIPVQTNVSISISNILLPNLYVRIIDKTYAIVGSTYHNNGSSNINFSQILNAGDYYLEIYGTAPGANYVVPYNFILTKSCITNAPTVITPVSYCQNATATPLSATGSNLLWYTTETGGTGKQTAPTPSTVNAGTTYYYVSQTANSCESQRAEISVIVNAIPTAPTVISPVKYCQNANASVLSATGTNLLWYNSASGGTGSTTAPKPSTMNTGNTYYYVSQKVNSCESQRAMITVTVNPNLPVSIIISADANPVCASTSVTFKATPTNGGATPSYQWKVKGVNAGTNSNSYSYTPSNGDIITCVLTSNATPCATSNPATSSSITMTVNPIPTTPIITQNGKDLASNAASGNQWYDSNGLINGATSVVFTPLKDGDYYVIVTKNGCKSKQSNTIHVVGTGIDKLRIENGELRIYPNPNDGNFIIEINGIAGERYNLEVWNILGMEVFKENIITSGKKHKENINLLGVAPGVYQVRLFNETTNYKKVLVINR